MNPSNFNDPEEALEEAATQWLLEREEGFLPDRAEAFAQWRDSNPQHAAAVARVERTLSILDEMPTVRRALDARLALEGNAGMAHVPPVRKFNRLAWAAGIAAAVVIGVPVWRMALSQSPAPQRYEAVGAEPRRVSLADGSVVDLNADSRVEVQFTEHQRNVTLVAGEAHFQVAHNKARPFIVTAHGIAVRAVGTAFDVRLAGDKIDVLVSEGKVEVARQETSAFFSTKSTPVVPLLVAGKRIEVTPAGESVPRIEQLDAAEVRSLLAWQNRMMSFADVPLREMVARINRCNTIQLVLGDPQLGDRKVGGVIDLSQVNAFVKLLEQDGEIISQQSSAGEIVLRRAR